MGDKKKKPFTNIIISQHTITKTKTFFYPIILKTNKFYMVAAEKKRNITKPKTSINSKKQSLNPQSVKRLAIGQLQKNELIKSTVQKAIDWIIPDFQKNTESIIKITYSTFKEKQMNIFTYNFSSAITFLSCRLAISSTFLFCQLIVSFHSLWYARQTAPALLAHSTHIYE